uniref:Uncharacterized protein n=1 Tax=Escherichia coli TaxID=562 RepID=A0A649Z470_ECOLX|nr:hypothetical protein [Escherichia coli]
MKSYFWNFNTADLSLKLTIQPFALLVTLFKQTDQNFIKKN